jgi:uncharacterized linocin/CFP29 family protein
MEQQDFITHAANGVVTPHGSVAQRLLRANMDSSALRTNATLRKEEWIAFDAAVVRVMELRLRAAAALMQAGLTFSIGNGMGQTVVQWETQSDPGEANLSMDGRTRGAGDRPEWTINNLPLPITHSDFEVNARELAASRRLGNALDTTMAEAAGRRVAERLESMVFTGATSLTFGGATIYGMLNHPNRNPVGYGTNGDWGQAAKTGENMLTDALSLVSTLETDRFYGPYWLFIPGAYRTELEEDFKANSDRTIRERLEAIDGLDRIIVSDQMTADNIALVQASRDVVDLVVGMDTTTVEWEVEGGMLNLFKVMQIIVPRWKADYDGRSGIAHMS